MGLAYIWLKAMYLNTMYICYGFKNWPSRLVLGTFKIWVKPKLPAPQPHPPKWNLVSHLFLPISLSEEAFGFWRLLGTIFIDFRKLKTTLCGRYKHIKIGCVVHHWKWRTNSNTYFCLTLFILTKRVNSRIYLFIFIEEVLIYQLEMSMDFWLPSYAMVLTSKIWEWPLFFPTDW